MGLSDYGKLRGIHWLGDLLTRNLRNASQRGALAIGATRRHGGRRRREHWICHSILAARVGPRGKIHSFEPEPRSFGELQRNVSEWEKRGQRGAFVLHAAALGARSGTATLHIPASFEWNGGRTRIETSPLEEMGISELDRGITKLQVTLVSLDDFFSQGERLSVVKLDLEGFELDALMGMKQMLRERRIRYIVFEDTGEYPAPTHHFLREVGYSVFRLDHGFFGIKCCCDKQPRVEPGAPNYVATDI